MSPWEYDSEANAGYARLKQGEVASTHAVCDAVNLDLAADASVLGVEILFLDAPPVSVPEATPAEPDDVCHGDFHPARYEAGHCYCGMWTWSVAAPVVSSPGADRPDGDRCDDLTRKPGGYFRCILPLGHKSEPGRPPSLHQIDLSDGTWQLVRASVRSGEQQPKPCIACGETHDDGPTDSDGNVWCGECAREATP